MEKKKSVKVLLAAVSVLLCFVIFLTALAGTAVLDVRLATSKRNIQRIVHVALSSPPRRIIPAAVGLSGGRLMAARTASNPENELVEWLAETLEKQYGGSVNVSADQIQEFLTRSTVKEYLSDKISGFASDLLNGTSETVISNEEIRQLIQENSDLIESFFGIPVNDATYESVIGFVEDQDINTVIREQVIDNVRNMTILSPAGPEGDAGHAGETTGGTTVADLLNALRRSTSWLVFALLMVLLLAACTGLFFTGGKDLFKTIRTAAIPLLVLGILLTVPTALLQIAGSVLLNGVIARIAGTALSTFAFVHYGVLVLAVLLMIAGSVIPGILKKKKPQEAPAE